MGSRAKQQLRQVYRLLKAQHLRSHAIALGPFSLGEPEMLNSGTF